METLRFKIFSKNIIFIPMIALLSFIIISINVLQEINSSIFPFLVLSVIFLLDTSKIRNGYSLDLTHILIFPRPVLSKFLFLLKDKIWSYRTIHFLMSLLLVFYLSENAGIIFLFQSILLYIYYSIIFNVLSVKVTRSKMSSILIKTTLDLFVAVSILLSTYFKNLTLSTSLQYYLYGFLLITLPLNFYICLNMMNKIMHKQPFFDLNIIRKYNRNWF